MFRAIDIYSEDDVISWSEVKASGVQGVYIKATDGISYVNPKMDSQYHGAKSANLLVGFYHFAQKNPVQSEYNHFMTTISKYHQDLKPVLDYEVINRDINFIKQFMAQNSNLLLYSNHSIADASGLPISRIWIAEPGTSPSDTKGYAGIQYSWKGNIKGITNSEIDMDIFDDMALNNGVNVPNNNISINNARDSTIRTIQEQLNTVMKCGLVVDGIIGNITISAIKNFQRAMGLASDGIWGKMSVGAIEQIYARPFDWIGATHYEYATRYIQFRCGSGRDKAGYFSKGTANCLSIWQRNHGLTADGKCGSNTWHKLLDENC